MTKPIHIPSRVTDAMLRQRAAQFGGTVEIDEAPRRRDDRIQVVAPSGQHWASSGGIHIVATRDAEGRADAYERIGYGTEPCDDPHGCGCALSPLPE